MPAVRKGKAAKKLTFRRKASWILSGMRRRARSRRESLPFSTEEFSELFLAHAEGSGRCSYCNASLTPKEASVDHMVPLERGGTWDLSNLCVCCISCNKAKGRMTADEWLRLMTVLNGFDPQVRNEVIGRLKAGASVVRLRFLGRKR